MIIQSERVAILIEEFSRCNLTEFCTAPGSRNTPLLLAGLENAAINFRVFHDERSMAFFALGIARRGKTIPVVLTTSGTAVANLLPAVIEAEADSIPMILISADRPPEQLGKGANQTIVQTDIFGAQTPTVTISEEITACDLLELISELRQKLRNKPGPIHINLPLKKPLLEVSDLSSMSMSPPVLEWFKSNLPWKKMDAGKNSNPVASDLNSFDTLVVGANTRGLRPNIERTLSGFKGDTFFDIQSGSWTCGSRPLSAEVFGNAKSGSRLLIIGHRFTEHRIWNWVSKFEYVEQWKTISGIFDPNDTIDKSIDIGCLPFGRGQELPLPLGEGPPSSFPCSAWERHPKNVPTQSMGTRGAKIKDRPEELELLSYSKLVSVITSNLDLFENIHLANSLTIRAFDRFRREGQFARSSRLFFNRGASGIDGTLATGLGVAYDGSPSLVICGDHAFLYDLSILPDLHNFEIQATVIIVDNKGGRIFEHLPISKHDALKEYFVATPKADLAKIISAFGFTCEVVNTRDALSDALAETHDGIRFIIANVDPEFDLKDFNARTEDRFS